MAEISGAPIQDLADGGYLVGLTDAESPDFRRLRVDDLAAGVEKALTALQPEDVGSAALANADEFVAAAVYAATVAGLQAQIELLADLIAGGGGSEPAGFPYPFPFPFPA